MNDDELRRHLRSAAPDAPDTSGWAAAARKAAGRRRATRWTTAGAAAVTVALIGGMLWTSGGRDARVAVPAGSPSVSSSPAPAANPDCTAFMSGSPAADLPGSAEVARITLCPRSDGPTFTTPLDSLTTNVNAVRDAIAALPAEGSRDPDCTRASDRRYLVVFTTAAGDRTVLEAATANACGVTPRSDNARRWSGLLTILREAWAAQRATRVEGDLPIDCLPWDRPGLFTPPRTALQRGAVCVQDDAGGRLGRVVDLSPELLRKVAEDVARNTSEGMNIDATREGPVLTLAGPWGDPLVFGRLADGAWMALLPDGGRTQLFWHPEPDTADALKIASQQAEPTRTPTPIPTPPGETYLPPECRGLTPSSGPLPTTATRLRLCPTAQYAASTFTPLDTLSGTDAVAEVLRLQQAQGKQPQPAACNADYGPDFLLVAETDGEPPVVLNLQLYGCRVTGTTDDPRTGADAILAAFQAALQRLRAVSDLIRPLERPGGMCRRGNVEPISVMPIEPSTASYVLLCRYSAGGAARQSTLGDTDARRILQDVRTNTREPTGSLCLRQAPASLVLTDPYADALVLVAQCGGAFMYTDAAGRALQWTPSATVQPLVKRLLR